MRAKVPNSKKSVTRGVSLKPEIKTYAEQQGFKSGWGFSGYLSALIEYARENDLLAKIIARRMEKSAK